VGLLLQLFGGNFALMIQVQKYTIGWDMVNKVGYLTIFDETGKEHVFSHLTLQEISFLREMLNHRKVHIDPQQWLVAGWDGL